MRLSDFEHNTVFYIFLGIALLAALFLDSLQPSISTKIVFLAVLQAIAFLLSSRDFSSPYLWFSGVFFLYSVSGPLLHQLDMHPWGIWSGYDVSRDLKFSEAMDVQIYAFVAFAAALGACSKPIRHQIFLSPTLFAAMAVVVVLTTPFQIINVAEALYLGVGSKNEFINTSITNRLGAVINVVCFCGAAITVFLIRKKPVLGWLAALVVSALFILKIGITGNRNEFFRYFIILLFMSHIFYKPINLTRAVLVVSLAILSIGPLQNLKMEFSTNSEKDKNDIHNLLIDHEANDWRESLERTTRAVFGTEFLTASNNLALILHVVPEEFPYYPEGVYLDVVRGIVPGPLVPRNYPQTSVKYNQVIHSDTWSSGGGVGFSLVGSGYVYGGMIGVISLFLAIGALLRAIYRYSVTNATMAVFYAGLIPVLMIALRADIGFLISQCFKQLPIVFVIAALIPVSRTGKKNADS